MGTTLPRLTLAVVLASLTIAAAKADSIGDASAPARAGDQVWNAPGLPSDPLTLEPGSGQRSCLSTDCASAPAPSAALKLASDTQSTSPTDVEVANYMNKWYLVALAGLIVLIGWVLLGVQVGNLLQTFQWFNR